MTRGIRKSSGMARHILARPAREKEQKAEAPMKTINAKKLGLPDPTLTHKRFSLAVNSIDTPPAIVPLIRSDVLPAASSAANSPPGGSFTAPPSRDEDKESGG